MKLLNGIIRWVVCLVLVLSAGLLVIIFLSSKPELSAYLLRLILLAAVGLIGGLSARILFRGLPAILAILLSIFTTLLAILVIDHFYETVFQFQFIGNDFRLRPPTASDGSQFILMTLVSLLPLLLFRRSSKANSLQQNASKPKKKNKTFSQIIDPVLARVDPRNWQLLKKTRRQKTHKTFSQIINPILAKVDPRNWQLLKKIRRQMKNKTIAQIIDPILAKADPRNWKFWKKSRSKAVKRSPVKTTKFEKPVLSITRKTISTTVNHTVSPRKNTTVKPAARKFKMPGKIFKGSQADVKLVGEEEHVCPYCLEEVVKDDSRGVIVCPECGTWHHQDCWDMTDSCGVAHRNEL